MNCDPPLEFVSDAGPKRITKESNIALHHTCQCTLVAHLEEDINGLPPCRVHNLKVTHGPGIIAEVDQRSAEHSVVIGTARGGDRTFVYLIRSARIAAFLQEAG